jgi:hypothetical protein
LKNVERKSKRENKVSDEVNARVERLVAVGEEMGKDVKQLEGGR